MTSVLFVCLGNICRSPLAEGVFTKLVSDNRLAKQVSVDSAGTGSWHTGNPPDKRAQTTALVHGIDISGFRARQVSLRDFDRFEYIIAMDNSNKSDLLNLSPKSAVHRVQLFMDFSSEFFSKEVPDPYYGGDEGFEQVFSMIETGSSGLLTEIKHHYF
ncbi:MAG: phosphotyrosine protein phosphatase [Magnetovibrio sp.]|nr:phosphotyrosine protein phosphatase [Magnetovibrio sp.]|tara:strand:+ start:12 stop:485 length:474 start_codon:yes stop_codon:yes gene_type:complete